VLTGFFVKIIRQEQRDRDLIAAIKADDTIKALAALKAGANPNAYDYSNEQSLSLSEKLERFFDRFQHPDASSGSGYENTALVLLFHLDKKDNPTLLTALLNAGADPNLPSHGGGSTPLSCAVARPFPQSFQILLAHGANIHWKSPEGFTILHSAAGWGSPERVKSLLKSGLDIEVKDNMGETPLIYACTHNELDTVDALILLGADVNVRYGKRGSTALDWPNSKSIASRLRQAGAKTGKELDAETAAQAAKGR
jgi:ankyrin repeat protein